MKGKVSFFYKLVLKYIRWFMAGIKMIYVFLFKCFNSLNFGRTF